MDITWRYDGPVAVITWNDGENRLNTDSLGRLNEILDELEATRDPLAVVVTGTGKFFSNGLDLARFGSNSSEFLATIASMERTIGRLLVFPAFTVAAINGHAFAGGALLTCAFDHRVMREDRGYWCMNEAEIGLALDEKLWSILRHRVPLATATHAAMTAARFNGALALARGVVEELAAEDRLLEQAIAVATRYSSLERTTLARHKELAHGDEARFLGWSTGPRDAETV